MLSSLLGLNQCSSSVSSPLSSTLVSSSPTSSSTMTPDSSAAPSDASIALLKLSDLFHSICFSTLSLLLILMALLKLSDLPHSFGLEVRVPEVQSSSYITFKIKIVLLTKACTGYTQSES